MSSDTDENERCRIPPSYEISEETLEKVRRIMNENVEDITFIFKVLADPLRIGILRALETSELCVCVFAEVTNQRYSLISYHLNLLKEAKLVNCRRKGKFLIYYLTDFGKRIVNIVSEMKGLIEG